MIPYNPSLVPPAGPARRLRRQLGFANLAPDILASLESYLSGRSSSSTTPTHLARSSDEAEYEAQQLAKRIMMNPPQSFLDDSIAQGFGGGGGGGGGIGGGHHLSGPINIGPGGQITIPQSDSGVNGNNAQKPVLVPQVTGYPVVPTPANTDVDDLSMTLMTAEPEDLSTSAITSLPSVSPSLTGSSSTASATSSNSVISSSTTSISSSASSSPSTSLRASATSTSSRSTASASAMPSFFPLSDLQSKPFTQTTLFIFIMVLSSLIIVGIIATSLSWCLRWKGKDGKRAYFGGGMPCCGRRNRDPEDDFDAFDRLYAPSLHGADGQSDVKFGHQASNAGPGRSNLQDLADFGFPQMPASTASGFEHGSPKIAAPPPAMLEVRNGLPDEVQKEVEAPNTPRYLGINRDINVPWQRSPTNDSLPSPFLDPVSTHLVNNPSRAISDLERSITQDTMPSHAGSWASNLRNTLFAAISTGQSRPFSPGPVIEEDKFTRAVLPLHRRLSALSASSAGSRERERAWASYHGRGGLQVLDEKDDYNLPDSDAEAIQNAWVDKLSRASSGSSWTPSPRKPRVPLRGAVSPGLYETDRQEAWVPGGMSGTTRW